MRLILLLTLVALATGCAQTERTHTVYREPMKPPTRRSDPVGTVGTPLSPIQFLDVLKRSTNSCIMVFGESRNWVLETDIGPLLKRLDSQTPCAGVVSLLSSHTPLGDSRSTEGHEAALLIEGFREGYYPPALSSDLFHPNKEELKEWYQAWSKSKQTTK
jgi:hypothetical protein